VLVIGAIVRSINLGPSNDPREPYWSRRTKRKGWYAEDLESLLWTGTNLNALDGIGMALREHDIAYRVDCRDPRSAKVFVHPEDEASAREVLRGVLERVPPPE